jgi:hypothetical protein
MNAPGIAARLEPHRKTAWYPRAPASEEQVAAAEAPLGRRFPEDYRQLLRDTGGGSVYGDESRLVMFPVEHLARFNPDRERFPDLDRMVLFGDDQGGYVYFYDPEDRLGHGPWAIHAVPMGSPSPARAVFVARDLGHLVDRILAGEAVIE